MCEVCDEIDITIGRYERVIRSINDDLTLESAKALIVDLKAQKAALHPTQEK
jgi:hypothetical protein